MSQANVFLEPVPIKPQAEALVAEYRQSVLSDTGISAVELNEPARAESTPFPSKNEAIAGAFEIAKESKKGSKHLHLHEQLKSL